jgi:hypothetical protein
LHLQILKAAKTEDFNPNVVATRDEALERIAEFRRQRGKG